MQTPGEKELVSQLYDFLRGMQNNNVLPLILNIGAGRSIAIERQLTELGGHYICDRTDIDDCSVEFPTVRHSYRCPTEDMTPLGSGIYSAAFANYVLEHVTDIHKASAEISRVLRPSGVFVTSVPNPSAPEFLVAKHTPFWFHKSVRKMEAWETHYAWDSIGELIDVFKGRGLHVIELKYWSFTEGYLWRYPILNFISRIYDRTVTKSQITRLMGNVCVVFKKTSRSA